MSDPETKLVVMGARAKLTERHVREIRTSLGGIYKCFLTPHALNCPMPAINPICKACQSIVLYGGKQ